MPTLLEKNKVKFFNKNKQLINVDSDEKSIDYIVTYIDRLMKQNEKILFLQAKTASGKSTILPPALYQNYYSKGNKNINIACTQPRVATAIEIPKDVVTYSYKKRLILGENIGYQTKFVKNVPFRGITYMTLGVLFQQFKVFTDSEITDKYDFIIIDECHERSIDLDIFIYMIKSFLERNANKKTPFFIFMSATFNPITYYNYLFKEENFIDYSFNNINEKVYKNILYVDGQNYDIEANFLKEPSPNYIEDAYNLIIKLHNNKEDFNDFSRDIILFVISNGMMEYIVDRLKEYNLEKENEKKFYVIAFNRMNVNSELEQIKNINTDINDLFIYDDDVKHKVYRRIVIATTIAETGLTINSLKYVIDSGYSVGIEFYPEYGINSSLLKPLYKSMAIQRKGRVGRKDLGYWYPLYTESTFNSLDDMQYPDIIIQDITNHILYILQISSEIIEEKKYYNIDSIFNMFTVPSYDSMTYSLEKLFVLGYIDDKIITSFGELYINCGFSSPEFFRMILSGLIYNINILDLLNCYLYIGCIGHHKLTEEEEKAISDFNYAFEDDFIESLILYNFIFSNIVKYDKESILDLNSTYYLLIEYQNQYISKFTENGIDIYRGLIFEDLNNDISKKQYIVNFKKCIYEGFKNNTASLHDTTYVSDQRHNDIKVQSKYTSNNPKRIIFKNLNLSSKFKYIIKTNFISVIDNYYSIDTSLI
jgi:HrpA-like RNA helicase